MLTNAERQHELQLHVQTYNITTGAVCTDSAYIERTGYVFCGTLVWTLASPSATGCYDLDKLLQLSSLLLLTLLIEIVIKAIYLTVNAYTVQNSGTVCTTDHRGIRTIGAIDFCMYYFYTHYK